MAPFKLKFRMGGSRSTSQEAETDQPQPLLLNTLPINGSNTTIDSEHNTDSYSSLNNDQRALIQNNGTGEQIGYTNPAIAQISTETNTTIPLSPPPSYEEVIKEVLEENRLAALDKDNIVTVSPNILPTVILILNENSQINIQESTDSHLYSCSTMTTASQESILECDGAGSCDPLCISQSDEPNTMPEQTAESASNPDENLQCSSDSDTENNSDTEWNSHENQCSEQIPEINEVIDNKSSKELYKAVAKKWGITCKMSDQCRCMECQSNYFDCEFDDNENQKTDGGLGAGTPMFISEVMHGTACTIL